MSSNKEIIVAVTGVGAIIGQGIVRSLRASNYSVFIIGIDRSNRSPGPYLVDAFEQKPIVSEDSPEYLDFWKSIICKHHIKLVMPGLEVDMLFLDQNRNDLEIMGTKLVLNTSELIEKTKNKWDFNTSLAEMGYPIIPSERPTTWQEAIEKLGAPPLLLKPLQGNGSRGIVRLNDDQDFEYWTKKAEGEWMIQRIVGNMENEYTVGVFALGNGEFIDPLIFRRHLSTSGNTQEAEVIPNYPLLEQAIDRLCKYFRPIGPTNMQFRVENEIPYLLEINPRFSSSNSLRAAFGYNEAEMAIEFYYYNRLPVNPIIHKGVAWRYLDDFIINVSNSI